MNSTIQYFNELTYFNDITESIYEGSIVYTEEGTGEVIFIHRWNSGDVQCEEYHVKIPYQMATIKFTRGELRLKY